MDIVISDSVADSEMATASAFKLFSKPLYLEELTTRTLVNKTN